MMNAAARISLEKRRYGRLLAQGVQKLNLGVLELDEHRRHAVRRYVHRL